MPTLRYLTENVKMCGRGTVEMCLLAWPSSTNPSENKSLYGFSVFPHTTPPPPLGAKQCYRLKVGGLSTNLSNQERLNEQLTKKVSYH